VADIHSRFILDDQASNPLAGYITVAKNAASATTAAQRQLKSYESALRSTELASAKATAAFEASAQQLDAMRAAGEAGTAAYKQLETQNERLRLKVEALGTQTGILTGKARETQAAVEKEAAAIREQADAAEKASKSTKELSDNQKAATSSADALASAVKRLAASYLSIQGLKRAVDLSDSLVSTRARLDRMNDGLQTTQQLETMIYQSAQRSRGNFMDTMGLVSQLGTMAGSAFDNTKEIVQFAEQLNKQLALSGASGQAAQAAILQMEQGLASGVLRGDELNSVMEQAPAIARSIADYLQVDMGKLREMGAQGQITAAIVKNAMFAAAAETNAEFAKTPMTWAQVWTVASNAAIRALDPLLPGDDDAAGADEADTCRYAGAHAGDIQIVVHIQKQKLTGQADHGRAETDENMGAEAGGTPLILPLNADKSAAENRQQHPQCNGRHGHGAQRIKDR